MQPWFQGSRFTQSAVWANFTPDIRYKGGGCPQFEVVLFLRHFDVTIFPLDLFFYSCFDFYGSVELPKYANEAVRI